MPRVDSPRSADEGPTAQPMERVVKNRPPAADNLGDESSPHTARVVARAAGGRPSRRQRHDRAPLGRQRPAGQPAHAERPATLPARRPRGRSWPRRAARRPARAAAQRRRAALPAAARDEPRAGLHPRSRRSPAVGGATSERRPRDSRLRHLPAGRRRHAGLRGLQHGRRARRRPGSGREFSLDDWPCDPPRHRDAPARSPSAASTIRGSARPSATSCAATASTASSRCR